MRGCSALFGLTLAVILLAAGCMTEQQWRAKVAEDRQAYLERWADEVPEHVRQSMVNGEICKGMTVNQVLLTWPRNSLYTGTYWTQPYKHSSGRTELELVSSGGGWRVYYTLYFNENGRLAEWFEWNL